MTWAAARAAYKARLVLAGTDVSPHVTIVRYGEPDTVNNDTIAFWAEPGTRPSSTPAGANSLNLVFIERGVVTKAYLRGAIRAAAIDETLEDRLVAVEEAMFNRLWGAWSMGTNVIGLRIDASTYGWELVGTQLCRTVEFTAWLDLPSVASIVP